MNTPLLNRRAFLETWGLAAGALMTDPASILAGQPKKPRYRISLAAWSLHRMFFALKVDQLGMVRMCRQEFGIGGFEMVNTMWPSPTNDYCRTLARLAGDLDVKLLLIMCDAEGDMASPDRGERMQAARNHHKWVDLAAVLGCHSIRCNAGRAAASDTEAIKRAAESFTELVAYGNSNGVQIIIENHGGGSSDPNWLIPLIKEVDDPHFGVLPDFGNFPRSLDKYDAIERMMPYAKAVSAKCYDFDDATGLETTIDFARMIRIVTAAGYDGHIGIEFEGRRLDEITGIKRAKALLEKLAIAGA